MGSPLIWLPVTIDDSGVHRHRKVSRSPSQFATWLDCPRKWAFARVMPRSPAPSAELGTRVHKALEGWLRDAIPLDLDTDEGRIASAGLEHLPPPGVAIVESNFKIDRGHYTANGYRDFVIPMEYGTLPTVGDHKTTSGLQWAKSEEDLRTDPQGVIYAASAMLEFGVEAVDLRWVYYTTRAPYRSRKVQLRVYHDDVAREFDRFDAIAHEMEGHEGANPREVPFEISACEKYGGCPYVAECGLTGSERMSAIMTQASFADQIKAKMQAKQQAAINPPEAEKAAAPVEEPKTAPATPKAKTTELRESPASGAAPDLRTVFAARALQGFAANPACVGWDSQRMASEAFALADEMIKARG